MAASGRLFWVMNYWSRIGLLIRDSYFCPRLFTRREETRKTKYCIANFFNIQQVTTIVNLYYFLKIFLNYLLCCNALHNMIFQVSWFWSSFHDWTWKPFFFKLFTEFIIKVTPRLVVTRHKVIIKNFAESSARHSTSLVWYTTRTCSLVPIVANELKLIFTYFFMKRYFLDFDAWFLIEGMLALICFNYLASRSN